jgi:hypothetical protein
MSGCFARRTDDRTRSAVKLLFSANALGRVVGCKEPESRSQSICLESRVKVVLKLPEFLSLIVYAEVPARANALVLIAIHQGAVMSGNVRFPPKG